MTRTLIAIASYKRPEGLQTLLTSLQSATTSLHFTVLVVDNDSAGSAREVAEAGGSNVRYVIEPEPGIAAARNRALDEFDDFDEIIFVDDDEHVAPGWLDTLVERAASSRAGVIMGPVQSVFPKDTPSWVLRGNFIQRPEWADGADLTAGATNNTLVKHDAWVEAGRPRFDPSFSSTGGSDAKFFSILIAHGIRIEYCSRAVVFEPVPPERMKPRWLARRAYRNGVVSSRLWVTKHGRLKTLLRGFLMVIEGVIRTAAHLLSLKGLQASSVNTLITGIGVVSSLTGHRVHEYKR